MLVRDLCKFKLTVFGPFLLEDLPMFFRNRLSTETLPKLMPSLLTESLCMECLRMCICTEEVTLESLMRCFVVFPDFFTTFAFN